MADRLVSSPASPDAEGANRRSPSTGHGKKVPRYLQAPSGSCHDLCKYGKHNDSDKKQKTRFQRKLFKKADDQHSIEIWEAGKKEPSLKVNSQFNTKVTTLASSATTKVNVKSTSSDEVKLKKLSVGSSADQEIRSQSLKFSSKTRGSSADLRAKLSESHDRSMKQDVQKSVVVKRSPKGTIPRKPVLSEQPALFRKTGTEVNGRQKQQALIGSSSSKSASSRTPKVLTSKTSSNGLAKSGSFSRLAWTKRERSFSSPRAQLPSKILLKKVASFKSKKQEGSKAISSPGNARKKVAHGNQNKPLQENTQNDVKDDNFDTNRRTSAESSPASSSLTEAHDLPSRTDEEAFEYYSSQTEEDSITDHISKQNKEAAAVEQELKNKTNQNGGLRQVNKDVKPEKLSFRRGKVVHISSESKSPRRLQFRRRRMLVEGQNVESANKLHFKRREHEGNLSIKRIESEKIVLRHQDVQGKKDGQGLFNNVIEETASKLVETRKSKVKALVGAFETVISLQDGKHSASTVA